MYYICEFSDSWTIYDENTQSSRQLDKGQVDSILSLFPAFNNSKILEALHVRSIAPNKLLGLTTTSAKLENKQFTASGSKNDPKIT